MSGYMINPRTLKREMRQLKKSYRKKIEDVLKIVDIKKPTYYAILRRGIMGQESYDKFAKYIDMEKVLENED